MSLREVLERISTDYGAAKSQALEDHPLARYIRSTAADEVRSVLEASDPDLLVKGSPGSGNWAEVPWIAIFDPLVTDSATGGYYVVYLFHASEPEVHLSLNQGTTATREEFGARTRNVLADRAAFVRKRLADFADVLGVDSIKLGSEARLPGDYAAAHALGMTYRLDHLPSDEELRADLHAVIRAYRALTFRGGLELTADDESGGVDGELTVASLVEKRQYRLHRRIERDAAAARVAKKHHGTRCQACRLEFAERYGPIGKGFIEAHHLRPISSLNEGAAVIYDVATDFAVLCPNCHRMIHRTPDPSDLQKFRELILTAEKQGKGVCGFDD